MTDHTHKPERSASTHAALERRAHGAQIANYIHALSSRHAADAQAEQETEQRDAE